MQWMLSYFTGILPERALSVSERDQISDWVQEKLDQCEIQVPGDKFTFRTSFYHDNVMWI